MARARALRPPLRAHHGIGRPRGAKFAKFAAPAAHFDVVGLMREAVGSLLAYQSDFDAHRGQVFFATHWYIPLIVVSAYIVLLRLGVRLMAARSPFELTALSRRSVPPPHTPLARQRLFAIFIFI